MNGTSGKLKDENKWSNCRKLFSFTTDKLCAFLKVWNSHKHECGEHNWKVAKNSKCVGSAKEWTQTMTRRKSGTVLKKKKLKRSWK